MASTRLYRDGEAVRDGIELAEVSELGADHSNLLWIDLTDPEDSELAELAAELGLHPLAIEDVHEEHQRSKLDRYDSHLFLVAYALIAHPHIDELERREINAFVLSNILVTVRPGDAFDMAPVQRQWAAHPELIAQGVGGLLWGLLDVTVDSHFDTVQQLDEQLDALEEAVFAEHPQTAEVQRAAYVAHKQLVTLRQLALPMREVVGEVMRRKGLVGGDDLGAPSAGGPALAPYVQDVYDHTLRVADWTDSLRDLVSTILDTNLTAQGNRMNLVMKKVTSWAAIIAVPTLVTGFYGMNVQYPMFGTQAGFWVSSALMVVASLVLYLQFKAKDWL